MQQWVNYNNNDNKKNSKNNNKEKLQEKQTLAGHQADYFALLKKIQEEVRQVWAICSMGQIDKLLIFSQRWLNISFDICS